MAENLKNTLQIDGTEYNINAVKSDVADKVTNPLVIKKSDTSGITTTNFDGSAEQTIEYVPATGGSYNGAVYQNKPTSNPAENEFITSAQINNRIVDLNGAPACVWDTSLSGAKLSESLYALIEDTDQLYKFTTIIGTESDFYLLQGVLNSSNTELTYSLVNTLSPILGWKTTGSNAEVSGIVEVPKMHTGTYNGSSYNGPVSEIGTNTFRGKTKIVCVLLPDKDNTDTGIRVIGNYAFQGCTGLRSITIPNSVENKTTAGGTELVKGWFKDCINLKNVVLGTGLESIESELFQNCSSLTNIVIPASITKIAANAFDGCINLKTVYYTGTATEWSNIEISNTGNDILGNENVAKIFNYTPTETTIPFGTKISLDEISEGPFIYICKDEETVASPAPNKVFLKLPESNEIVEISKGATCLSSTYTTASYTYEGLAEIIARINKRLEAIGGEELKINQTDIISKVPTIKDVDALVPDIEVKEYFDPASIPTIQSVNAKLQSVKADLDKLIEEVYTLTEEVEYELEHGQNNQIFSAESRIDILEDWQKSFRVDDIEYYDTIEWTD